MSCYFDLGGGVPTVGHQQDLRPFDSADRSSSSADQGFELLAFGVVEFYVVVDVHSCS